MNDKLKREYNRLKVGAKRICVSVSVDEYEEETALLNDVGLVLERGEAFLQLNQGGCGDGKFMEIAQKIAQLTAVYDATLALNGSLAVSYFVEPDAVLVDCEDIEIEKVRELLSGTRIVGYRCSTKEEADKAIKRGVDYIVIPTPSISTQNVVIEYAKWVYENIEIPVFLEVDSIDKCTANNEEVKNKFLISINHYNL